MSRAALAVLLVASTAAAEPPAQQADARHRHMIVAWSLGAAAAATAVTSLSLGFTAHREYDAAFASGACIRGPMSLCDARGYADTSQARTLGTIGTGFGIAAIALAIGSSIAYFTAPHEVAITPVATTNSGGIALSGTF